MSTESNLPNPDMSEGPVAWLNENMFNGPFNTILTLIVGGLLLYTVPAALNWLVFDAVWTGGNDACRANPDAACWPFVTARWEQFLYGFYEHSERWRVNILLVILAIGIVLLAYEKTPLRRYIAFFMLVIFPIMSFFLLYGNEWLGSQLVALTGNEKYDLPIVDTPQWGGFMLTLVIALSGIVASLPLGILLALGRRSSMPRWLRCCLWPPSCSHCSCHQHGNSINCCVPLLGSRFLHRLIWQKWCAVVCKLYLKVSTKGLWL